MRERERESEWDGLKSNPVLVLWISMLRESELRPNFLLGLRKYSQVYLRGRLKDRYIFTSLNLTNVTGCLYHRAEFF